MKKLSKPKNVSAMNGHHQTEKWSVLLVDNEPIQLTLIGRLLSRAGYDVVMAEDGQLALQQLQNNTFNLLLTDWDMPNLDGIGLCRSIRSMKLPHYTYTILLTSRDAVEHIVMGLQAGADDYLTKPIMEPELLARLNTGKRVVTMEQSLRQANEENQRLAYSHPLTQVSNYRYLMAQLPIELEKAARLKCPLSIILCDIDCFKNVNDVYGHPAGGDTLIAMARFLDRSAKDNFGWVAHHGGDEFAIVLPNVGLSSASKIADSIRMALSKEVIQLERSKIQVTASFGVSGWEKTVPANLSAGTLFNFADQAVYESKSNGRNQVTIKTMSFD